ncbi:hypothetical protein V1478_014217 [Vespula squamosa]|uniref:Uncharacterized protein n=1 Tax=Vespula squamosa TaxID=30214 RepID=A0ABD2A836_VESSQ
MILYLGPPRKKYDKISEDRYNFLIIFNDESRYVCHALCPCSNRVPMTIEFINLLPSPILFSLLLIGQLASFQNLFCYLPAIIWATYNIITFGKNLKENVVGKWNTKIMTDK